MRNIGEYVLRIVAAALLCCLCQAFFDGKKANGVVIRMITGLLLAIAVLSPVVELRIEDFTEYLGSIRENTASVVAEGELIGQSELKSIITQRSEAYILEKAKSLNLDLEVEIKLSEDQSPRPESVRIRGAVSPYAKSVLRTYITDTLGIPEDKQQWIIN